MSFLKRFYRCGFCRCDLRAIPFSVLRIIEKLMAVVGLRIYQCPHCFDCAFRPYVPSVVMKLFRPADSNNVAEDDDEAFKADQSTAGIRVAPDTLPSAGRKSSDYDCPVAAG